MAAAEETRTRLVEAATEAFAEHGVFSASLVEITRRAGQRNRGAVHYHFGSRDGLLVEVLEQHAAFLAERERALLAHARTTPADDIASVIEAIVRPSVELAETGPSGRRYLVIVGQLVDEFDRVSPQVEEALERTGGYAVYALLAERLAAYDEALRNERLALVTGFILRSVADRARATERTTPGRPQLTTERFVANLVSMATGMATAPMDESRGL
ncbi:MULTISPECIES: TetR/AcrR family transcriptional regulator [unclassified Nocardioides]|uniref:TetR/AcrR family transcriptional regulator n=1 Tax=unclassified Nocardioides TaxID=2615069 RepID=UPI0009F03231|nr:MULTISPECIES: TetR/AcrR family transcriptional regulator [unclassified Nocardioides]GAW50813.1 TetR family transcriptional regulator [Nocardioides sp. PD653-B2]GAW52752.1 TetR family transcriptional regulator [Nocardioides sp. PD653]